MAGGARAARTPAQRWEASVARHRDACRRIVSSSPRVRYAGAINEFGRTLAGAMRPGTRPLLGPGKARDEFFVLSTLVGMRKGTAAAAGPLEHVIVRHSRVTVVAFQRRGATYYVSVDRGAEGLDGIIAAAKRAA